MNITWNTDVNAPCCPGEIVADDGRTILIQDDWGCPGVASTFGWSIRDVQVMNARYYGVPCDHNSTDGTLRCPDCHLPPSVFIAAARLWLDEHNGATVEDPGYWGGVVATRQGKSDSELAANKDGE